MYRLETSEIEFSFNTNNHKTVNSSISHFQKVFSLEDSFILTKDGDKILVHTNDGLEMGEQDVVVVGLTKEGDTFGTTFSNVEVENQETEKDSDDLLLLRNSFDLIEAMVQKAKLSSNSLILIFIEDFDTFFEESSEEYAALEKFIHQNMAVIICDGY